MDALAICSPTPSPESGTCPVKFRSVNKILVLSGRNSPFLIDLGVERIEQRRHETFQTKLRLLKAKTKPQISI